jgi:hypothetical protein
VRSANSVIIALLKIKKALLMLLSLISTAVFVINILYIKKLSSIMFFGGYFG